MLTLIRLRWKGSRKKYVQLKCFFFPASHLCKSYGKVLEYNFNVSLLTHSWNNDKRKVKKIKEIKIRTSSQESATSPVITKWGQGCLSKAIAPFQSNFCVQKMLAKSKSLCYHVLVVTGDISQRFSPIYDKKNI